MRGSRCSRRQIRGIPEVLPPAFHVEEIVIARYHGRVVAHNRLSLVASTVIAHLTRWGGQTPEQWKMGREWSAHSYRGWCAYE
jgi:hypothetical protein